MQHSFLCPSHGRTLDGPPHPPTRTTTPRRAASRDRRRRGSQLHLPRSRALLTSAAVFGINLAIKPIEPSDQRFQGSFDRLRASDHVRFVFEVHGVDTADLSPKVCSRKKGQLAPLYRASDLRGVRARCLASSLPSMGLNSDLSPLRCEGEPGNRKVPRTLAARLPSAWRSIAFNPNHCFVLLHYEGGVESQETSCGFLLRSALVKADLSRAHRLESVHCSGLTGLREASLATARAVAFDGCTALHTLRAPAGDAALVSLNLDGCRSLAATTPRWLRPRRVRGAGAVVVPRPARQEARRRSGPRAPAAQREPARPRARGRRRGAARVAGAPLGARRGLRRALRRRRCSI